MHAYIAVDCGSLTAPVNGKVVTSSGTTFMNLAAYSCNTGYNLVGVGTRMCIADGNWSPVAPVCQSELKVKISDKS